MQILIIGYGIVGHNLAQEIRNLEPDIYDKYKIKNNTKQDIKYDIAFICVDTPLINNELDISEVKNAIQNNDSDIYVIKSTCPIGTVDFLKKETNKHIIFSPEYYGGTQHCNNFSFDFTILGGDKEDCIKVIQALQYCYDGRHQFKITDSKTAELVKFMENSFLATKVSFCNQFYDICQQQNISYEELRELFILDKRMGDSHTFVYKDKPY
jgi:UDPglucose 6-dehydrogenase